MEKDERYICLSFRTSIDRKEMLKETSINFNDRSIFTKIGFSVQDLESQKKGVIAGWNYGLSDNALINLSPHVMKYTLQKYGDWVGISDEYTRITLQDSSNLKWTEEQKKVMEIAQEFVKRNKSKIRNAKDKDKKKQKRMGIVKNQ